MKRHAAFSPLSGCLISLAVGGYQFGQSNHTVYLLEPLRRVHPQLLTNDWFATQTLQYHSIFSLLTAGLMRVNLLEPAFLVAYLALIFLLHLAWLKITDRLGGSSGVYLLSVVLYYLSYGGMGLGMYDFLQDSALLPGNIANVAMLWGIVFWLDRRWLATAAALGLAGIFHLNYAVVGLAIWIVLLAISRPRDNWPKLTAATILLLAMCLANIIPAARAIVSESGPSLARGEFVDLYVHLRHPHHYDPASWPVGLWISFLWVMPMAILAATRRDAIILLAFFAAILVFALFTAGIWFAGPMFVQLSLWRFSVFLKLLSCVLAAIWLAKFSPRMEIAAPIVAGVALFALLGDPLMGPIVRQHRLAAILLVALMTVPAFMRLNVALAAVVVVAAAALAALNFQQLGLRPIFSDDSQYQSLCRWAADPAHTPVDAVFLVPPQEESMRWLGQRAIVVNFKAVPQLAAELPEWRDRLQDVLDTPTLLPLAAGDRMDHTLQNISARYDQLSADQLIAVAGKYGARYIVARRGLNSPRLRPVYVGDDAGAYLLYDSR